MVKFTHYAAFTHWAEAELGTVTPIHLCWSDATPIKHQNWWLNVGAYLAWNVSALNRAPKLSVSQKQEIKIIDMHDSNVTCQSGLWPSVTVTHIYPMSLCLEKQQNPNLKETRHPKMKICWKCTLPRIIQDVDELVSSSVLEKCSITSFAH